MNYNPNHHRRRSIRLQEYDYSQAGLYLVTICTQGRRFLFGDIKNGMLQISAAGQMVCTVWDEIPSHYVGIDIDEFVIMPNHIHGIVIVGAGPRACPSSNATMLLGQPRGVAPTVVAERSEASGYSLPHVVHRFKTMTTKKYVDGVKQSGWPRFDGRLWQRNYWEHIIRDEKELARIRDYIKNNPIQWESDKLNRDKGDLVAEPRTDYGEEIWMI